MPERTCIVTREKYDSLKGDELIRFVLGPDNKMVPDLRQRLPGRGVWVTSRRNVLEQAVSTKAFARAMRSSILVDDDLPDLVAKLLTSAALGALGFAKKSGDCVIGLTKVKNSIEQGRTIGLFHAKDGSDDGQKKLEGAIRRAENELNESLKIWRMFESEHLGLALGATNVIHAALLRGKAGTNCMAKVEKLVAYEQVDIQE